ncbi:hypothetical protein PTKIN_Ptkin02bG0080700 [Pterospermum kingtungense]
MQNMVVTEFEERKLFPLPSAVTAGGTRRGIDQIDVKPLQIIRPEGPSFHVNGNFIEWQKALAFPYGDLNDPHAFDEGEDGLGKNAYSLMKVWVVIVWGYIRHSDARFTNSTEGLPLEHVPWLEDWSVMPVECISFMHMSQFTFLLAAFSLVEVRFPTFAMDCENACAVGWHLIFNCSSVVDFPPSAIDLELRDHDIATKPIENGIFELIFNGKLVKDYT